VDVVSIQTSVGQECIGVDSRAGLDMITDVPLNVVALQAAQDFGANGAVSALTMPRQQPITTVLPATLRPRLTFSRSRLLTCNVPRDAVDIGLIGLNLAVQLAAGLVVLQREPKPRQHEPCGLLGNAERAGQFVAADTVLALGEQPIGESSKMVPTFSENLAFSCLA
jgi:hypothetical protein